MLSNAGPIQFHVARGDTCLGCFPVLDILARVEKGELDPFDHVYDDDTKDWIAIAAHPAFSSHQEFWNKLREKTTPPKSDEKTESKYEATAKNKKQPRLELENGKEAWFVLKGDHRFGPFEYLELVRLTQEKNLNDWDYVWTKRLPKWVRLSTLPEFQAETIQGLRDSLSKQLGGAVNEVFFRRRFARAGFESSILVHDNKNVYRGRSIEMSAGGLSLVLGEDHIKLGDKLHLHVKPSRETPAFNSSCEVVTRKVVNAGDAKSPVIYGLKFLGLEEGIRTQIDGWATRAANSPKSEAA